MPGSESDASYNPDSLSEDETLKRKRGRRSSNFPCKRCGAVFPSRAALDGHSASCGRKNKSANKNQKGIEEDETRAQPSVQVEDEVESEESDALETKIPKKYVKLSQQVKKSRALRRRHQLAKSKLLNNPITQYVLKYHREHGHRPAVTFERVEDMLVSVPWASDFNLASWLETNGILSAYLQQTTIQVTCLNNNGETQQATLEPLEAKVIDADNADAVINAAGPIWSCSFRPESDKLDENRYFTVGLSRIGWPEEGEKELKTLCGEYGVGSDFRHTMDSPSSFPNMLQLWEYPFSSLAAEGDVRPPQIAYGIVFENSGPIWSSVWCPYRFSSSSNLLGIVAAVCGDGCIRVLAIPKPLRNYGENMDVISGISKVDRLSKIVVISEKHVALKILRSSHANDRFTCVAWDPSDCHQLLCGHADGTLSLWRLRFIDLKGLFGP